MMKMPPIAVMSFDRPDYLEKVVRSLAHQDNVEISDRDVFLFQDGAVNPLSGVVRADASKIDECVRVFRNHFPYGTVFLAESNLGVAFNFERAERLFFQHMRSEWAVFLEDDLVLSPNYIHTLVRLWELVRRRDDIGYFAAYGEHLIGIEEQRARRGDIVPLAHNWGFGLARDQWLKSKYLVDTYLSIIRPYDYLARPHHLITEYLDRLGVRAPSSSQDYIKSIACYLSGGAKINTAVVNALYIGERGVHFFPEHYEKLGYRATQVYSEDGFEVSSLTDEKIEYVKKFLRQSYVK